MNKKMKWINISNTLQQNPDAIVVCPECNKESIKFVDVQSPYDEKKYERTIYCVSCNQRVHVLLNK